MIPLARLLLIAALSLVAVGPGGASTSATVPGAESDVRLLAQQLEAIHPDLFASVSRARFRAAVDDRRRAAPTSSSENELLVELMRLAALPGIGNGHTGIFPGDPQHRRDLHFYPLRLYAFPDGTYVVDEKATDGLVGARVTADRRHPVRRGREARAAARPARQREQPPGLPAALRADGRSARRARDRRRLGPLEFTFTQRGQVARR